MGTSDIDLASARTFALHAGGTFVLQVAGALTGGASVLISARSLGPEGQGIAYSLVALGTVPSALLGGGLVGAIVRLGSPSRGRGSLAGVARAAASLSALGALVVTAILVLGDDALRRGITAAVLGAVVLLSVLVPVDLALAGLLRSTGRMTLVAAIDLGESLVVLALLVVAGARPGPLEPGQVVLFFALGLVASIVTSLAAARHLGILAAHGQDAVATTYLGIAMPLSLGAGLQLAVFRFDVVGVRALLGEAAAGLYSVAARIAEPALLLPGAVSAVVTSRSSRLSADDLRRTTPTIFWVALLASALPVAVLAVGAHFLVTALFGAAYGNAIPLVVGIAISRALVGSGLILSEDMNQRGHHWTTVSVACGVLAAVGPALLVVRGGSVETAAWAIAVIGVVFVLLSLEAYRRTAELPWGELLASASPRRLVERVRVLRHAA